MSSLRLVLLGAPRLEHGQQIVPLRRSKALALVAYLAVIGKPQHRDTLTTLIWPEFDMSSARNNLRRELSLLKGTVGIDILVADRMQVTRNMAIDLWIDVVAFEAQIERVMRHNHTAGELCSECVEALTQAEAWYSDDFMAGFSLPDSPSFDEWQFFKRESLRQQLATVLQSLIAWHSTTGQYNNAIRFGRRWVGLDPLHEPAHRELMRLYAWSGQESAALRQYEECARILNTELGIDPEAATSELYAAIKRRQIPMPSRTMTSVATAITSEVEARTAQHVDVTPPQPAHNLPATTTFVGRRQELMDIIRRFTDPGCRLLTLTGPGGIGKTQLVLHAAHTLAAGLAGDEQIADGVMFVPLAAINTVDDFIATLATAAGFNFDPHVPPKQQLLDYFRPRRMLVVLDNFEQLIDAAYVVDELLIAAPHLRLLITSREALNLSQEWFHPVEGLSYPADDAITDVTQLAQFDAVQLFDQSARRVRIDFVLHREYKHVVRLCRLVEGIPLAIELAASWLKLLSVDQVVAALERNLDILTTRNRNIPERHRSMRTVLDASWRLLTQTEARTLARLSLFQGGFSADAAHAVAGATLELLAVLVEKSLIRCEADGRYQMHELLRQYGFEQLTQHAEDVLHTRQAHSAYYIEFLATLKAAMAGNDQPAAVAAILTEQENVRAAWQFVAEERNLAAIAAVGHTLAVFYEFRGRYQEGVAAFERAIDSLRAIAAGRERNLVYAARLVDLAWLYIRLGDLPRARTALEESRALFESHQIIPLPEQSSDPLLGLGMVALYEGQYAEAAQHAEAALLRCDDPKRAPNRPRALYLLMKAAHAQGYYPAARRFGEEALSSAAEHGHSWLVASLYNELGTTLCAMHEYAEASHHYQTYYTLREAFDDRRGMATALLGLGKVALYEGRYPDARSLFDRSLQMIRQVGARVDTGLALDGLAAIACATGDVQQAQRYLAEALQLALTTGSRPLLLTVLIRAAQLLLPTEKSDWGPEALVLVLQHPAADSEMTERVYALLEQYERNLPHNMFSAAVTRAQNSRLNLFTSQLQAILATPLQKRTSSPSLVDTHAPYRHDVVSDDVQHKQEDKGESDAI